MSLRSLLSLESPRSPLSLGSLVSLTSLGVIAAVGAQPPASSGAAAGDAERGRQLYYDHGCYACHGFNGETGARDLVGTNSPLVADVDTFITFLRLRGDQAPVFPSTRMPSYPASALSDDDARDVYAYISSFELNAPDAADVPVLEAIIDSAARPYEP